MDATALMVDALKAGETIRLVLARGEPMSNAHALLNKIEREHTLRLGRIALVSAREVVFYVWAEGIGTRPELLERRAGS